MTTSTSAPPAGTGRGADEHGQALAEHYTHAADLAHALGGKAAGDGYTAHCPAHDDVNPSLSISDGDDGRPLVHCHAGCEQSDVIEALRSRGLWPESRRTGITHPTLGAPHTVWTYRNPQGRILGYVCRWETPKSKDIRPYVNGRWKHFEKPRPLYGLDRLARNPDAPVIVCEGEKAADAAQRILGDGYVVVTWPGGTNSVSRADWSPLQGRTAYVWPDADEPGRKAARAVTREVAGARIVEPPEGKPQGWDAADAEREGITRDHVAQWITCANAPAPAEPKTEDKGDDDTAEKKSASTRLVEIAQEMYRFGVSTTGEAFAIPRRGPKIVATLRGSRTSLRGQLAREYFRRNRRAASQQALADALAVIEGMAQEAQEHVLHVRVARSDGAFWLDMGDDTGRAVKITGDGWTIEPKAPVFFKRTPLIGALPEPESGNLDELWHRLNIAEHDRPLIAAWLVAALDPDMPHPVLAISGEQGTAKSSAAKHCSLTIDPGPVPLRKPPRDGETWVTAAAGSWIVGLDNMSSVSDWLSDSICRAVTGDGDVRRRLYTDGEHAVFSFRRCVIVNSIDLGAVRGDLSERMLPIGLEPIPESERMTEDELWQSWSEVHPRILGAVLDLAAGVAGVLPGLSLSSKPRMADFARVVAAVDEILGTDGLPHYLAKQNALATDSLSGDPFMVALGEQITIPFMGTSSELVETVTPPERTPKHWPASARSVTQHLRRHAPALRRSGWQVSNDGGSNKLNTLMWTLVPPTHPEMSRKPDSPHSHTRTSRESASLASEQYGQSQDDCDLCGGAGCAWCRESDDDREVLDV